MLLPPYTVLQGASLVRSVCCCTVAGEHFRCTKEFEDVQDVCSSHCLSTRCALQQCVVGSVDCAQAHECSKQVVGQVDECNALHKMLESVQAACRDFATRSAAKVHSACATSSQLLWGYWHWWWTWASWRRGLGWWMSLLLGQQSAWESGGG